MFAQAQCLDARARLAQDRLLLAHKLFQHGPAFLHHMLHIEYGQTQDSWLHGVFADLQWLHKLDPVAVPLRWTHDLTELIEFWQFGGGGWKSMLRKLGRRHILQEAMMTEVHGWHRRIFQTLTHAGGIFQPSPSDLVRPQSLADHQCFCGRVFTTAVGLATHQRKQHQMLSLEHDLVIGATCPACLKHFWSSQRLQQHLAYRTGRNECYQILKKAGFKGDYARVPMPAELAGLNRANWIQSCGPHPCYKDLRISELVRCEVEIASLVPNSCATEEPAGGDQLRQAFFDKLRDGTMEWPTRFPRRWF